LSKTLTGWSKALALHHNTCLKIFTYLAQHKIGDLFISNGPPPPLPDVYPPSYPPSYLPYYLPSKGEVTTTVITIVNRRMVRDHQIRVLRSKAGTLGGNPNFEKGKPNPYYEEDKVSKEDKQKITPSSSSSSSTTNTIKEGDQKRAPEMSADFLQFYEAYPNKTGKREAWERWKKLNGVRPVLQIMLDAIAMQKRWRENAQRGEFRPEWKNPATWLNKGCWEDKVGVPQTTASGPKQPTLFIPCPVCQGRTLKTDLYNGKCPTCNRKEPNGPVPQQNTAPQ
jgi:hypothetical protein